MAASVRLCMGSALAERVGHVDCADHFMLINGWVWLRSRVCLLTLVMDLGLVLEEELGQKWRYGTLKACLC